MPHMTETLVAGHGMQLRDTEGAKVEQDHMDEGMKRRLTVTANQF